MVLHPNDDEALFSLVAPHGRLLLRASVVAVIAHVFKVVFVIHVVVFVFVFAANDDTTPTAATLVSDLLECLFKLCQDENSQLLRENVRIVKGVLERWGAQLSVRTRGVAHVRPPTRAPGAPPPVIDYLGRPLDQPLGDDASGDVGSSGVKIIRDGPVASELKPIDTSLHTGTAALDALAPLGRGQSMLILGPHDATTAIARARRQTRRMVNLGQGHVRGCPCSPPAPRRSRPPRPAPRRTARTLLVSDQ